MICVPVCDDVEIELCHATNLGSGCRYYNWENNTCDYPNRYKNIEVTL
jgi:hypothetical protein